MQKVLIANRGEIAVRIIQAATELGIETLAIYSEDDSASLHCIKADNALGLVGIGAKAYLDAEQIVSLAIEANCDAIHPGYGFLSENAMFASLCQKSNIIFIGPEVEQLSLFGNKTEARKLADACAVPLISGTNSDTSLDEMYHFLTHSLTAIKYLSKP